MLVITQGEDVLLEQRPDSGIWGGLLSLPEIGVGNAEHFDIAVRTLVASYGELDGCRKLQPFSHVFTHFKLHVAPFQVALKSRSHSIAEGGLVWYPARKLADAPLPAPVKKLLLGVLRADDLLATA